MKLYSHSKELSWILLLPVVVIFILQGCNSDDSNSYYSLQDFSKVKKIDVHTHVLTAGPDLAQQAKDDNFILISLNAER